MTVKKKNETIQDLQSKILELESQLIHRYHFAAATIDKASTSRLMGSGVVLQLTGIGGKEIINPVCIKDGLSDETIAAIKADLKRSFETLTMFKP